ncbi:MAG TPA: hypothetical protein PK971_13115 [Saprospiraceae bacterium]|nr:hypothetical protein [Saprospiraceae bacterium]HND89268.1 hypothetical protein [Saprospiraceae bacterium]HNG88715.1 hypothetical protein [Saprospiraceae bacterium]
MAALLLPAFLLAQSTAYVIQAGPSIGIQKWDNSFDREPLFKYHVALAIETVDNEQDRSALLMQLGYHVKGSANRFTFLQQGGGGLQIFTEEFRFNNLSMMLGAKGKFPIGSAERARYFYFGGIRGDYTLSTNIDELADRNPFLAIYYPQVGFVNRWMFGVSVGGGLEFKLGELVGGQLTLSVNPDLTNQYNQPPLPNVIDPFNPGQSITISQRRIRNTTLEVSVGLRLLRKVEYIDE